MTLAQKLHPSRFTAMSPKMAAIVAFILGEQWTVPTINSLTITSDGILLTALGNEVIGSAADLENNLARLMVAADLAPSEVAEVNRLYASRVSDWRHAS